MDEDQMLFLFRLLAYVSTIARNLAAAARQPKRR